MIRHPATTIELAAALAATIYILVATMQNPDHPAVNTAELGASLLLVFAALVLGLALCIAVRLWAVPQLARWRCRRAVRRLVRLRARQLQRRHAARIGGGR